MKQYTVRIKDALFLAQYNGKLSYMEVRAIIAMAARNRSDEDPKQWTYMQALNMELQVYGIDLSKIDDEITITFGS